MELSRSQPRLCFSQTDLSANDVFGDINGEMIQMRGVDEALPVICRGAECTDRVQTMQGQG